MAPPQMPPTSTQLKSSSTPDSSQWKPSELSHASSQVLQLQAVQLNPCSCFPLQLQGVGQEVLLAPVALLKQRPLFLSQVKKTLMFWSALSMALCPWKLRKPAGLPIALTEVTKGTRLQELQMAQAVVAQTVRLASWATMVCPGFMGSGQTQYSLLTLRKSAWRGEQAYSHQKRFRLTAHTSHPPEAVEKTPSSCFRLSAVSLALASLQQRGPSTYYEHAVMVQLRANSSTSTAQGRAPFCSGWVQTQRACSRGRRRARSRGSLNDINTIKRLLLPKATSCIKTEYIAKQYTVTNVIKMIRFARGERACAICSRPVPD